MIISIVLCFLAVIAAEIVTVKPSSQFCFYEKLNPSDPLSSKFGLKMQVFNDDTVSIRMSSPSVVLYSAANKKDDSFSFAAQEEGEYVICLDNTMGTTPKTVSFSIIGGVEDDIGVGMHTVFMH